jgi:hypothetical protein
MTGQYLRGKLRQGSLRSLITNAIILPIVTLALVNLIRMERMEGGTWVIAIGLGIVILVNLLNIPYDIKYRGDPTKHPSVREVLKHTGISLDELSGKLEAELLAADKRAIFGGVRILPSFIYQEGFFSHTLIPIDDVAWVHKKVTTRRVNFVPVSKTYSVVLHSLKLRKMPFEFAANSDVVDAFLMNVASRVPWALLGWDAGLAAQWNSNRAAICAQIQQRREKMLAERRPAPSPVGAIAVSSPLA